MEKKEFKIEIDPKGPYIVHGEAPIHEYYIINGNDRKPDHYEQGEHNFSQGKVTALCRCGMSKTKPYCDGSHLKLEWQPELIAASCHFMDDVRIYDGTFNVLWDKRSLCAGARFCEAGRGVWAMIENPSSEEERVLAVRAAQLCPAGRLVVQDKASGDMLEPHMEPSIGLIEDTPMETSGPLWVMGGIRMVIKGGVELERRNRVTLCRCGASQNKPYCDGTHISIRFKDDNF